MVHTVLQELQPSAVPDRLGANQYRTSWRSNHCVKKNGAMFRAIHERMSLPEKRLISMSGQAWTICQLSSLGHAVHSQFVVLEGS